MARAILGPPQLSIFRAGAAVAAVLPAAVGRRVAERAGGAAARLPHAASRLPGLAGARPTRALAARRRQTARHLQRVCGTELHGSDLDRAVRQAFGSYARYWAESLRLPALTRAEVEAGMRFEGIELLFDALEEGRGAILALPHLGGWEWGGMWLAHTGRPVSVVVETLEPPEVFDWFVAFRRRLGMDVIPNGPGAAGACIAALRQNRVLCLLSDRVVGDTLGVEVEFFGERTHLPAGPVTLGLRTGAPVLPAAVYFGAGSTEHLAVVRPRLDLTRGDARLRAAIAAGTQVLAGELETLIRRAPTQWHLMHPNWPSDLV